VWINASMIRLAPPGRFAMKMVAAAKAVETMLPVPMLAQSA